MLLRLRTLSASIRLGTRANYQLPITVVFDVLVSESPVIRLSNGLTLSGSRGEVMIEATAEGPGPHGTLALEAAIDIPFIDMPGFFAASCTLPQSHFEQLLRLLEHGRLPEYFSLGVVGLSALPGEPPEDYMWRLEKTPKLIVDDLALTFLAREQRVE